MTNLSIILSIMLICTFIRFVLYCAFSMGPTVNKGAVGVSMLFDIVIILAGIVYILCVLKVSPLCEPINNWLSAY